MSDEFPAEDEPRPTRMGPRRPPAEARELDDRPFVERYRGTLFDVPVAEAPPTERRKLVVTWPLVIGVVMLLVALVVTASFVLVGNLRSPMSAFRNTTPAPTHLVTPGPVSTGPTPVPTPSPTPAWMADSRHPAALFIQQLTAPTLSFRLAATLDATAAGQHVAITYGMDVAGPDYSLSLTLRGPPHDVTIETVLKNGYSYARTKGGPWVQSQGAPPAGNPFGVITTDSYAGLEYVGQESIGGHLMHHVRLPVYRWPAPADRAITIVRAPSVLLWDVWVDEAGRPRSAVVTVDVVVRLQGQDIAATLDYDYDIYDFGKEITIQVPRPFR